MESDAGAMERLDALRVPLTGYCYRMLGSFADADDATQETLIRAASRWEQYDDTRAQLSTWVHRIATNICLDMLRSAKRRALLVDPQAPLGADLGAPLPAATWVEPAPGTRVLGAPDPGEVVAGRESVRLAFVVALQRLAPRQRAVLVLRDVLAFSARDAATVLDTTVPAVNSALQRARAVLAAQRADVEEVSEPDDASHAALLRRYVRAFEAHDVAGLVAVLRDDAVATMPPYAWRVDGAARIAGLMGDSESCAGARLVACDINGATGFGQYRPDDDGVLRPFALVSIDVSGGRIAMVVTFLGTATRFPEFGLPETLDPADR